MAGAEGTAKPDLAVRTLSALVMAALAGGALWLGGWWWIGFVALVALGVFVEWNRLTGRFARSASGRGLWNAAGLIYIGSAGAVLVVMRNDLFGLDVVLTLVGAVVATDVGAYLAGRTFGGPRIAPKISPSKTWSGLIGGMAGAAAVLAANRGYNPLPEAVTIGILLAVIAQSGDFFESWMKRRAGVKDSGHLIPGHGGLFDRVDGLLAVLFVVSVMTLLSTLLNSDPGIAL